MSLEIALKVPDFDQQDVVANVPPGDLTAFPDYSDNILRTLIFRCLSDNTGGEIYAVDYTDMPDDNQDFIPKDFLNDERLVGHIGLLQQIERPVVLEDRRSVIFVVTHKV